MAFQIPILYWDIERDLSSLTYRADILLLESIAKKHNGRLIRSEKKISKNSYHHSNVYTERIYEFMTIKQARAFGFESSAQEGIMTSGYIVDTATSETLEL